MSASASVQPARWLIIAAFAAVYLVWGSSYLGIQFAVATMPPFVLSALRFTAAGVLMIGWMLLRGAPLPSRRHWWGAAVCGLFLFVFNNGALSWAQAHGLPSSIAALLIATTPLWVVLVTWLQTRQRPAAGVLVGVVIGFAGLGLLINPAADGSAIDPVLAVIVVLAALAWVIGGLYGRGASLPDNAIMSTGLQLLVGGLMMAALAGVTGDWARLDWGAISVKSWAAAIYLAIFSSIIAFTAFVWLMRVANPATVATYAYVNPVIALILGAVLANETLDARSLLAAAIILGSVVIITRARTRSAPPQPVRPTIETAAVRPRFTGR